MASLNSVATVNITVGGAQVQVPSFSIPLVAAYVTATEQAATGMNERVRFYSSAKGLLDEGFTVNSAAYRAIAPFFSQSPSVNMVALGRLALAPDLTIDIYPTASSSRVYTLDLLGPAGLTASPSYTSDSSATVAEITAGLVSAINTAAVGITATDQTTYLRLKAASAGMHFGAGPNSVSNGLFRFQQTHADPGVATDLAAIAAENNSFYTLSLATAGKAEVLAASAWALSNSKLALLDTQDGDILTATAGNVALTLQALSNDRAMLRFGSRASLEHGASALLGTILPHAPGSVVAKFRQPQGVTSDALSDTSVTNLKAASVQFSTNYGSVSFDGDGKMSGGEFLDVTRDRDWAVADMQAEVANVLLANRKLPFTDVGIQCVVSAVRASLQRGEERGVWASGWTVTAPKVSEVAPADKAARNLSPVRFAATLAGSIFSTVIDGTVSL